MNARVKSRENSTEQRRHRFDERNPFAQSREAATSSTSGSVQFTASVSSPKILRLASVANATLSGCGANYLAVGFAPKSP